MSFDWRNVEQMVSDTGVRDARDVPPEEYWDRFRAMLGSEGLITYWYLGRAFNQYQDPDTMRLRRDMRNPAGGVLAAPLAIAAPETGGWRDREVVPAPVAYSLHILEDAADVAEVRVARSTVRRGRTMGFSRSEITDAARPNRVIAVTTGIGITLGDAPPVFGPSTCHLIFLTPTSCLRCTSCSAPAGTPTGGDCRPWPPGWRPPRRPSTSARSTSPSRPRRWKRPRRGPVPMHFKPRTGTSTSPRLARSARSWSAPRRWRAATEGKAG